MVHIMRFKLKTHHIIHTLVRSPRKLLAAIPLTFLYTVTKILSMKREDNQLKSIILLLKDKFVEIFPLQTTYENLFFIFLLFRWELPAGDGLFRMFENEE